MAFVQKDTMQKLTLVFDKEPVLRCDGDIVLPPVMDTTGVYHWNGVARVDSVEVIQTSDLAKEVRITLAIEAPLEMGGLRSWEDIASDKGVDVRAEIERLTRVVMASDISAATSAMIARQEELTRADIARAMELMLSRGY